MSVDSLRILCVWAYFQDASSIPKKFQKCANALLRLKRHQDGTLHRSYVKRTKLQSTFYSLKIFFADNTIFTRVQRGVFSQPRAMLSSNVNYRLIYPCLSDWRQQADGDTGRSELRALNPRTVRPCDLRRSSVSCSRTVRACMKPSCSGRLIKTPHASKTEKQISRREEHTKEEDETENKQQHLKAWLVLWFHNDDASLCPIKSHFISLKSLYSALSWSTNSQMLWISGRVRVAKMFTVKQTVSADAHADSANHRQRWGGWHSVIRWLRSYVTPC